MKSLVKPTQMLIKGVLLGMFCVGSVSAQTPKPDTESKTQAQIIKEKLKKQLNINADSVSLSPVDGFYQVFTERGLLYVSSDAKQLLHGKVYSLDGGVSDLTESAYTSIRQKAMTDYDNTALVYPAKDEKYQVSVFTDITCGYCRKMHSEIEQYNALGITVKYYAYPRGGLNSKSSRDLDVIWCDKDPEAAMTAAKQTGRVSGQGCVASPVTEHFKIGSSFGVGSTPALVFEDGSLIPGYKPPKDLLALLQSKKL